MSFHNRHRISFCKKKHIRSFDLRQLTKSVRSVLRFCNYIITPNIRTTTTTTTSSTTLDIGVLFAKRLYCRKNKKSERDFLQITTKIPKCHKLLLVPHTTRSVERHEVKMSPSNVMITTVCK